MCCRRTWGTNRNTSTCSYSHFKLHLKKQIRHSDALCWFKLLIWKNKKTTLQSIKSSRSHPSHLTYKLPGEVLISTLEISRAMLWPLAYPPSSFHTTIIKKPIISNTLWFYTQGQESKWFLYGLQAKRRNLNHKPLPCTLVQRQMHPSGYLK